MLHILESSGLLPWSLWYSMQSPKIIKQFEYFKKKELRANYLAYASSGILGQVQVAKEIVFGLEINSIQKPKSHGQSIDTNWT